MVEYVTVDYGTVEYGTVEYHTVEYSTVENFEHILKIFLLLKCYYSGKLLVVTCRQPPAIVVNCRQLVAVSFRQLPAIKKFKFYFMFFFFIIFLKKIF